MNAARLAVKQLRAAKSQSAVIQLGAAGTAGSVQDIFWRQPFLHWARHISTLPPSPAPKPPLTLMRRCGAPCWPTTPLTSTSPTPRRRRILCPGWLSLAMAAMPLTAPSRSRLAAHTGRQELVALTLPPAPQTLADATVLARDLTNERADVATPQFLEDVARSVAASHGMEVGREIHWACEEPSVTVFLTFLFLCPIPGDVGGGH